MSEATRPGRPPTVVVTRHPERVRRLVLTPCTPMGTARADDPQAVRAEAGETLEGLHAGLRASA